jgi:hypothetical protein
MTSRGRRRSKLSGRLLQLATVMVASAGLAYGGTAAFATRAAHPPLRPLANVFAVLRHAHRADAAAAPREPIGGASATVFAAAFATGDSVFVATLDTGDICLVDQEPAGPVDQAPSDVTGLTAVACAHPAEAEQTGLSILTPSDGNSATRITVLVPDGVQSVVFDESNGTAIAETPVDNVAQYAAPNLASANFVTPSGENVSEADPATPGSTSS